MDDAAVIRVTEEYAVVFTVDFITPIVDDAHDYGRIAAANSLSDVWAMGAKPLAALNLVCWPDCLSVDLLGDVLAGGDASARAAGCPIVGGHTIEDKEPKFGMAVIGLVHPDRIIRNRGAKPGDRLYISKALGTGILATAMKGELASPEAIQAMTDSMTLLNRDAADAALAAGVRAMTDVTGFGLLGHLSEMLDDDLGVSLHVAALPILPGVIEAMSMGLIPAGTYRNRQTYLSNLVTQGEVDVDLELLISDPQTSGGILAAIPAENAIRYEQEAAGRGVACHCIGKFHTGRGISLLKD